MKIENKELINITGGAVNITGSLIAAFVSGINSLLDMGRSLGTAVRFYLSKKRC